MTLSSSVLELNPRVWLPEQSWLTSPPDLSRVPDTQLRQWAELGIDWIWMMGVWAPSPRSREICLRHAGLRKEFEEFFPGLQTDNIVGSPYSVRNYTLNPALGRPESTGAPGTMSELRGRLNSFGMRLMLDFVPNHTAIDHPWTLDHPDYYMRGAPEDLASTPDAYFQTSGDAIIANGRDPYFAPWTDTAQLNYFNPEMRRALEEVVLGLAKICDGIRCDMAMLVSNQVFHQTWGRHVAEEDRRMSNLPEFWPELIRRVKEQHPNFVFAAEVYWGLEATLQEMGFDYTYDKALYDRMAQADGAAIRAILRERPPEFQMRCMPFTENHDERRAAAAFGSRSRPAALLAATLPGLWLQHDGQWEGRRKKLPVQVNVRPKEPVDTELGEWYRRLLMEIKREPWRSGSVQLLGGRMAWPGNPTWSNIIAIYRSAGREHGLAVVNIGETDSQCYLDFPAVDFSSELIEFRDVLNGPSYDRSRAELRDQGLFIDLKLGQGHLFRFGR